LALLDELIEEHGAFPDDPGGLGLFVLTSAETQSVVHSAFLVKDYLLLLDKTNSFLLYLISLKNQQYALLTTK
jgi:hypothetical protein